MLTPEQARRLYESPACRKDYEDIQKTKAELSKLIPKVLKVHTELMQLYQVCNRYKVFGVAGDKGKAFYLIDYDETIYFTQTFICYKPFGNHCKIYLRLSDGLVIIYCAVTFAVRYVDITNIPFELFIGVMSDMDSQTFELIKGSPKVFKDFCIKAEAIIKKNR